MTESLIMQKVHFWTLNGINGSTANPGRAPIVRTKKQMNKCMAEMLKTSSTVTVLFREVNITICIVSSGRRIVTCTILLPTICSSIYLFICLHLSISLSCSTEKKAGNRERETDRQTDRQASGRSAMPKVVSAMPKLISASPKCVYTLDTLYQITIISVLTCINLTY